LCYREETINVAAINAKIGINLSGAEMADLLGRMCLRSTVIDDDGSRLKVGTYSIITDIN
jgi:hypothetical protein